MWRVWRSTLATWSRRSVHQEALLPVRLHLDPSRPIPVRCEHLHSAQPPSSVFPCHRHLKTRKSLGPSPHHLDRMASPIRPSSRFHGCAVGSLLRLHQRWWKQANCSSEHHQHPTHPSWPRVSIQQAFQTGTTSISSTGTRCPHVHTSTTTHPKLMRSTRILQNPKHTPFQERGNFNMPTRPLRRPKASNQLRTIHLPGATLLFLACGSCRASVKAPSTQTSSTISQ